MSLTSRGEASASSQSIMLIGVSMKFDDLRVRDDKYSDGARGALRTGRASWRSHLTEAGVAADSVGDSHLADGVKRPSPVGPMSATNPQDRLHGVGEEWRVRIERSSRHTNS